MKKLFETKMINTGGRSGVSKAPDGSLVLKIEPPEKGDKGATNPEQLFAAGYAACFNSALALVKGKAGVAGESTVEVTVSLNSEGAEKFVIGAVIEGHIDGVSLEQAQELLEKAHTVCPYSKAVKGNVEVVVKAI